MEVILILAGLLSTAIASATTEEQSKLKSVHNQHKVPSRSLIYPYANEDRARNKNEVFYTNENKEKQAEQFELEQYQNNNKRSNGIGTKLVSKHMHRKLPYRAKQSHERRKYPNKVRNLSRLRYQAKKSKKYDKIPKDQRMVYLKNKHNKHREPYIPQEPVGFGEPPTDRVPHQTKHSHGEPPIDSYGRPVHSSYFPKNKFKYPFGFESFDPNGALDNDEDAKQTFSSSDNGGDLTINDDVKSEYSFEHDMSYPKILHSSQNHVFPKSKYYERSTPTFPIYKRSPQNYLRGQDGYIRKNRYADQMMVGGLYAEPPARYIQKPKVDVRAVNDNHSVERPYRSSGYDSDTGESHLSSSYINYKHSNMAFSPQNLNDAFSLANI